MIRLSRKTDYALVALAYLAHKQAEDGAAVSARKISEKFGLPLPLLMNLLNDLSRAGIVTSVRGPQGGYALAAAPTQLTLKRVVATIEGPARFTQCCTEELVDNVRQCEIADACPIREPIRRLHSRLDALLAQTTLADLTESRVDVPIDRVGTCSCTVAEQVSPAGMNESIARN